MDKFFHPRSIAIIGASRDPNKVGHVVLKNLVSIGFPGKIYPINPNADEILGIPCYHSVLEVPSSIDLAIIVIPLNLVFQVLDLCARKNIKHVLMITAGFSETGNHEDELKLKKALERYHMRLIGPNCLGHIDTSSKINTIFLPQARLQLPPPGHISFLTQSGSLGSILLDIMAKEGIGIAKFVSYGNALDVSEAELLQYLQRDEKTKIICLYIEGLKDGKHFLKIAQEVAKKKPVVVMKGGISEAGAKAVSSHTASLAGSGLVFKGACKQAHLIQAEKLEELYDYARVLEKCIAPKGKRIQIITNGGGYGIVCSDAAIANDLELGQLSPNSVNKLKRIASPEAILKNPLDLTGSTTTEQFEAAVETCLNDNSNDILIVILLLQTPLLSLDLVQKIQHYHELKKKPIIALVPGGNFSEIHKKHLEEAGVPSFNFPENAIKAVRALCDYYLNREHH